jgi:GNAT superfamily N-acetyltransferase
MDRALTLRRAGAADAAVLAAHRAAMFRDMGQLPPALEAPMVAAATARFEAAMPAGEYAAWLALAAGGAVIGGAGVQLRAMLPRPAPDGTALLLGIEGVVLNVYVERPWRRRGVARRLMEAILSWAPGAGIVRLVLHPSSEGRSLYDSLGFVPTGELCHDGRLHARSTPAPSEE